MVEMLFAGTIAMFVIIAFSVVDVAHIRQQRQTRQDVAYHTALAYTMNHVLKHLSLADRVNLIAGTPANIQFRVPLALPTGQPSELDDPNNYTWEQYRYNVATEEAFFYGDTMNGCTAYLMAQNVTAMLVTQNANQLQISMTVEDPATNDELIFRTEVTTRAMSNVAIPEGLSDLAQAPVCT